MVIPDLTFQCEKMSRSYTAFEKGKCINLTNTVDTRIS